jgi:two-component SAPR family response regulator
MYFLRRDIDPWFDDDVSAPYIRAQGELVLLDTDKVTAQSAVFQEEATRRLRGSTRDTEGAGALLRRYTGRFAPEFEYEEWAAGWRDSVHAAFLLLSQRTARELIEEGHYGEAVVVARHALSVDPDAIDLEGVLIWLYARLGSARAAAEQYAHYASSYEEVAGTPPRSLADLVASDPD